jgi:transposase
MKFIKGESRYLTSLFPISLEESIGDDNEIRVIDAFVDSLNFSELGFRTHYRETGRPAYHPKDLLKLYIYGYMNSIRSSRRLEKECKRNIELMWLLNNLSPDHNTISNFRKDNSKSIKKVFRETVKLSQYFELVGGELVAGDSTKLRAQNSKKNNFNQKKIERHQEYIERKIEEYEQDLSNNDGDSQETLKKIEIKKELKSKYNRMSEELARDKKTQISTSDPDSRNMTLRNNISEVAYCVQSMVDAKHNLLLDFIVTNTGDKQAMGNMLQRTKSILRNTTFTALFDTGYHSGSELKKADDLGINVLVNVPSTPHANQIPDAKYSIGNFVYNKENDTYTCPAGETLTTNGKWYDEKRRNGKVSNKFKNYSTSKCKGCPVKSKCTKSERGRTLKRSEYTENIAANSKRMSEAKDKYRERKSIVEHPFGTMKRQWGFDHIMTKKYIIRTTADVGLVFSCYNLRRLISILGIDALIESFNKGKRFCAQILIGYGIKLRLLRPLNYLHKQGCTKSIPNYHFLFSNYMLMRA